MNELEDEPQDIQNATPVEDEVKRGETSERVKRSKPHRCHKAKSAPDKIDRCETKREKYAAELEKTAKVYVHGPPCRPPKTDRIPRHCMTKEEYLDFLAKPSKKCETPCEKIPVVRRVLPIPPRIEELAKPAKRRLILTLEERASIMTPEMIDNLIRIIEEETALTPEQAENFVRDKKLSTQKKSKRKKKKRPKCEDESTEVVPKGKKPSNLGAGEPCLDAEASQCQYAMAVRFVRSILSWRCSTTSPATAREYRDIADVLLDRLSELLDYSPVGNEDRKSQQMRLLADLFACWISGLLVEVAERRREELEAECLRRRREAEELAAQAEQEAWAEEQLSTCSLDNAGDDDDDDDDDRDDEEDDGEVEVEEAEEEEEEEEEVAPMYANLEELEEEEEVEVKEEVDEMLASLKAESSHLDASSQYELPEPEEEEPEPEEEEKEPEEELAPASEPSDAQLQTEAVSLADAQTLTEEPSAGKSCEVVALEKLASRIGASLHVEVPFLTFAKILDTLYAMIECESENRLCEPVVNRLHRAIYEKLATVLEMDNCGEQLKAGRTKDVLDVVSGKIALWLRRMLDDQQLRFLDEWQPEVASAEVRDWSKWMSSVVDMAEDWTCWIDKVAAEAGSIKRQPKLTRQEWQNWTKKVDANALLWRRTCLEALHEQHHNTMMLTDRKVVKTGASRPLASETAIKSINFDSASKTE